MNNVKTNKNLVVEFNSTTKNNINNNIKNLIDSFVLYDEEISNCNQYRFNLMLRPFLTNVLYNNNSSINGINKYDFVGLDIFNDYRIRDKVSFNNIKEVSPDNRESMTFEESIKNNLIEKDGWFGFYRPTSIEDFPIDSNSQEGIEIGEVCEFIELEPNREYFNFSKKDNWVSFLTYPYKIERDHPMVTNNSLYSGIPIVTTILSNSFNSADKFLILTTVYNHNLFENDIVGFKQDVDMGDSDEKIDEALLSDSYFFKDTFKIHKLGGITGEDKNTTFWIRIPEYINDVSFFDDHNFRVSKIINNVNCDYYIRKVKKIPNTELSKIFTNSFSQTIYGDSMYQIESDDVYLNSLRDHLGRPISEVFITFLKNTKCKSSVSINGVSNDINNLLPIFNNLTSGFYLNNLCTSGGKTLNSYRSGVLYGYQNSNIKHSFSNPQPYLFGNNSYYLDNSSLTLDRFKQYSTKIKSNFKNTVQNWINETKLDHLDVRGLETLSYEKIIKKTPRINLKQRLNYKYKTYTKSELEEENYFDDSNGFEYDIFLDDYFCDIVEYNPMTQDETILCKVRHRFNTFNRDYCDKMVYDNGVVERIVPECGPKVEGYLYIPHYPIKIKNFDEKINTINLKSYKLKLNGNLDDINDYDGIYELKNNEIIVTLLKQHNLTNDSMISIVEYGIFKDEIIKESLNIKLITDRKFCFTTDTTFNNETLFLRDFNKYVPKYIKKINNDTYGWREFLYKKIENQDLINGFLYIYKEIPFYLHRQDPFDELNIQFKYNLFGLGINEKSGKKYDVVYDEINIDYDKC